MFTIVNKNERDVRSEKPMSVLQTEQGPFVFDRKLLCNSGGKISASDKNRKRSVIGKAGAVQNCQDFQIDWGKFKQKTNGGVPIKIRAKCVASTKSRSSCPSDFKNTLSTEI